MHSIHVCKQNTGRHRGGFGGVITGEIFDTDVVLLAAFVDG
jgi:hypothetical protein